MAAAASPRCRAPTNPSCPSTRPTVTEATCLARPTARTDPTTALILTTMATTAPSPSNFLRCLLACIVYDRPVPRLLLTHVVPEEKKIHLKAHGVVTACFEREIDSSSVHLAWRLARMVIPTKSAASCLQTCGVACASSPLPRWQHGTFASACCAWLTNACLSLCLVNLLGEFSYHWLLALAVGIG